MVIFQNTLADVFQTISLVGFDFRINTDENSQARYDLTRTTCQQFVSYLYHKSKYAQKLNSINQNLITYETQICQALGSDLSASDESIKIVSDAVGQIQKLLLEVFPPESEDWKFLVKTFPQLENFRPD